MGPKEGVCLLVGPVQTSLETAFSIWENKVLNSLLVDVVKESRQPKLSLIFSCMRFHNLPEGNISS